MGRGFISKTTLLIYRKTQGIIAIQSLWEKLKAFTTFLEFVHSLSWNHQTSCVIEASFQETHITSSSQNTAKTSREFMTYPTVPIHWIHKCIKFVSQLSLVCTHPSSLPGLSLDSPLYTWNPFKKTKLAQDYLEVWWTTPPVLKDRHKNTSRKMKPDERHPPLAKKFKLSRHPKVSIHTQKRKLSVAYKFT
jgi:hypothetical protein